MKYLSFIENYKNMLGEIKGVSIDEIEYLENTFNLKFPEAYKEFLLIFGRDSGQLMPSYLMTINNLSRNIDCVKFDLENTIHSNTFKIEKNMFFFGQWQGSVFYFICNGNENPPVYFIQDFDKVEKYNEAENLINKNADEMWRINKQFIENAKKDGKEFFFSHDPRLEIDSFLKDEYNLLIQLGGKKDLIEIGDNLWKMAW